MGKTITKSIFGQGTKDEAILGRGVYKAYGKGMEGFSVSSIQFGIHYMFENMHTLENFLINVVECTKLNGYFIGTSFDGEKIFHLLKDKSHNESIIIKDDTNSHTLLEITKLYDQDNYNNDHSSLGYGVNVHQESINKTFKEYLVNYDYLVGMMEKFGFIPAPTEDLANHKCMMETGIGTFEYLYKLMLEDNKQSRGKRNEYGNASRLTKSEQKISFLNKYFIFKKVRNVNINDITIAMSQKTKEDITGQSKETIALQEQIKTISKKNSMETKKSSKKLRIIPS